MLVAPTGCSASNIKGYTYQSIFRIFDGQFNKLQLDAINKLRELGKDAKVLIIDEISLISIENLSLIDQRCRIMKSVDKPFGGLHVLLCGDFFQMKTINGTSIVEKPQNIICNKTRLFKILFNKILTDFIYLKENCRAKSNNGIISPLASFLEEARTASKKLLDVISIVNTRIVSSQKEAMEKAHPQSLWVTSTHKRVHEINKSYLKNLNQPIKRIIAYHKPKHSMIPYPDEEIRDKLYAVPGDTNAANSKKPFPTHIDLAIGSRVRCTRNISVAMGIYNGAMGTVYAFIYEGNQPQYEIDNPNELIKNFSKYEDHERLCPIVLVQMDDNGESNQYSCIKDVPRIIPFGYIIGEYSLINKDYYRYMIPLLPASARTASSVQGVTAKYGAVIDPGKS